MAKIWANLLSRFSPSFGIDLGTANTLVAIPKKGIVIREPSIICRHKKTKKVIAVGHEAKKMLGRTPASLEVTRPLKDGVISDFDATAAMLSYFVERASRRPGRKLNLIKPRLVIGVPTNITEVQRRAVFDAAELSGSSRTYLVDEPMVAALGAGLPATEPVGSMIVDIGGGTCEIAIISLGGIIAGRSLKIAGDSMDLDISNYIRSRYSLVIGERTAEELKINLGSALPGVLEKDLVVRGRDIEQGLPRTVKISSVAVREALATSVNTIVEAIKNTIEDAPPELASDIAQRGIVLCGGGALLAGLPKLVSSEVKMRVTLADDPYTTVVSGTLLMLEDANLLGRIKTYQN